jgi:hypothetical protein
MHDHFLDRVRDVLVDLAAGTRDDGRPRRLHDLAVLVGDDVLGGHDVAATHLTERLEVHIAHQSIADLNRAVKLQPLIGLQNLARVVPGDDLFEHPR